MNEIMNDQAYALLEVVDESAAVLVRFDEPQKAATPLDRNARALTRTVRQMQRRMRQRNEDWKQQHPEDVEEELPPEEDPEIFVLVERLILAVNEEQLLSALKRAKKAYADVQKLDAEGRLFNMRQEPHPSHGIMFRRPF